MSYVSLKHNSEIFYQEHPQLSSVNGKIGKVSNLVFEKHCNPNIFGHKILKFEGTKS